MNHPWKLVGPWYRWETAGLPSKGRDSRPVFQKYDGPKFVAEFMKDPQRSLKFIEDDFVHKLSPLKAAAPFPPAAPKPRRLSESAYMPTATRKLFLDLHKRFYLVVCELHCETTGFPAVDHAAVCQTGFVVRRRVSQNLLPAAAEQVRPVLKRIAAAEANIADLQRKQSEQLAESAAKGLFSGVIAQSAGMAMETARSDLKAARDKFRQWAGLTGVSLALEGWVQKSDGIGKWETVNSSETSVIEEMYPLYPLIPEDGTKAPAGPRTIYFGVVPTGSADTDEFGEPKFDSETPYEIHCFARRHKPECRKGGKKPDCCGPLTWSKPTETYRLAAHFDLIGTSQRPVSMDLPDLEALKAQASTLPPNEVARFRMKPPPNTNSNLQVTANSAGLVTSHKANNQICSFSIPLITIVATFVFKLFLPVVTLLFGLFFLLRLKFCIPPSIDLAADITAQLALEVDLSVDVSVDAVIAANPAWNTNIDAVLSEELGPPGPASFRANFGPRAVAQTVSDIDISASAVTPPLLTAKLQYEAHVDPVTVA
jgi:hypothetical protein